MFVRRFRGRKGADVGFRAPESEGMMAFEYEHAKGTTIDEMRENFRKTDLHKKGDARLVWVNEGDLFLIESQAQLMGYQEGPLHLDDTSDAYEPWRVRFTKPGRIS